MDSEGRLDALLTALQRADGGQQHDGADPTSRRAPDDAELAPLIASAQRLAPLRAAQPDAAFARTLETRLLARAAERRRQGVEVPLPARTTSRSRAAARRRFPTFGSTALRPALVAAAVILALGMGTLTVAAAAAGPGSPLFGLHRLEQSVQVGVSGDSAERARQHLQLAQQWVAAVRDAAAQRLGDPTYSDALGALVDEDAAAAGDIAQVPPGTTRDALEADLATLRASELTTLQAALPAIGWPDRIATTSALGALGAAVPHVTGATLTAAYGRWHVTLTGSGFEAGAVLLVDGQPAGAVTATSAGQLNADLRRDSYAPAPAALGIGNPDGTAAATGAIRVLRSTTSTPGEHEGTPEPGDRTTATPSPSSDDRRATPSPSGSSGGGSGSPTPDH